MKMMFKFLTILLVSAPFAAFAGDYKEITAEELVELKKDQNTVIIDSRSEKYLDGQIIEGATIIATGDLNEESLGKLAKKESKIVFYCSNVNCPASAKAAAKASALGYTNLYKYPGGMDEWSEKGLPVQKI